MSNVILFIGSNPSQDSNSTDAFSPDSKSRRIIDRWLSEIQLDDRYSIIFINISDNVTANNRPLKIKEIRDRLDSLSIKIRDCDPRRIITLGRSAEKALTLLQLDFFAMPHPSGLNRQLNDKNFVKEKINNLMRYLI